MSSHSFKYTHTACIQQESDALINKSGENEAISRRWEQPSENRLTVRGCITTAASDVLEMTGARVKAALINVAAIKPHVPECSN